MKKQLLILVMMLLPMVAMADSVEIDGIYYNLISKGDLNFAEINSHPNKYSGNIVIPETITHDHVTYDVTNIRGDAFYCCSGLTSITIPRTLRYIGDYAFCDCNGLKKVIIQDIEAWCGIHFSNDYSNPLKYANHIYIDNNTEITDLMIPDNITIIGDYVFQGCSYLTSLTIHNNVTEIGNGAFSGCSGISSITIPSSVKSIAGGTFMGCSSLTSITLPNTITTIGNAAFSGCSSLTSITLPNSITTIGNAAFSGCSALTSINLPNSITTIGAETFSSCASLSSISIPNNVTRIGDWAFHSCYSLLSINLQHSVTEIGAGAFYGCSALTSITLPNTITTIGNAAFEGCSALTSINLPNSITTIAAFMFKNCTNLSSIAIPSNVTRIEEDAFEGCNNLKKVIISDIAAWCGIQFSSIYSSNFSNPIKYAHHLYSDEDNEIKDLIIPDNVMSISDYAFYGCKGFTSVSICNGIKNIGNSVFASCTGLKDVYCYAENVPSTNINSFYDSYINYTTLHVPTSSIDAYKAAEPWKDFGEIVGLDGTTPDQPVTPQCSKPVISIKDGKLAYSCETEGAKFVSDCTYKGGKTEVGNEIILSDNIICHVSVYATKDGYLNSDVATADVELSVGIQGDTNRDGKVTITDAVSVVNIILNNGEATAPVLQEEEEIKEPE